MDLKCLGEFGLIALIRQKFGDIPSVGYEGIGDDCAVLPAGEGESLVVTADMLIEDIHFLRDKISPELLGRKSLAVNLSDVASMGAAPVASFLSIALPGDIPEQWTEAFINGYHALSSEYGVPLLGGDTTSSSGKIAINITAVGRIKNENIKRRSSACSGDKIFVTGYLGDSAKGLVELLSGLENSYFIDRHNNPKPYVREGEWLGKRPEVHAMMDISDGLASDLVHILKASGVGAQVNLDMIPSKVDMKLAVTGGEDYKLLFTTPSDSAPRLCEEYKAVFGEGPYEIGRIVAGEPKILWTKNGVVTSVDWKGFTHF